MGSGTLRRRDLGLGGKYIYTGNEIPMKLFLSNDNFAYEENETQLVASKWVILIVKFVWN